MNVRSVSQSEINITLGDNSNDVCNVRTSSDTVSFTTLQQSLILNY